MCTKTSVAVKISGATSSRQATPGSPVTVPRAVPARMESSSARILSAHQGPTASTTRMAAVTVQPTNWKDVPSLGIPITSRLMASLTTSWVV